MSIAFLHTSNEQFEFEINTFLKTPFTPNIYTIYTIYIYDYTYRIYNLNAENTKLMKEIKEDLNNGQIFCVQDGLEDSMLRNQFFPD